MVERINKDRISDMTLSILKPRRIEYTQKIAGELGVQVEPLEVANSVYDPSGSGGSQEPSTCPGTRSLAGPYSSFRRGFCGSCPR